MEEDNPLHWREEESLIVDVGMLIKSMENVMTNNNINYTNNRQGGSETDEISCLTEFSLLLSDIYEISENDVIFGPTDDYCIINHNNHNNHHHHQGNRRFGSLINDYTKLYCSTTRQEDKCLVVAEVIRVWRSLEPPGRFLVSTEPVAAESSVLRPPYHDIGDEDAKKRATELLSRGTRRKRSERSGGGVGGGGDNNNKNNNNNTNSKKHIGDDITASTTDSSTTTTDHHPRQEASAASQLRHVKRASSHKDFSRGTGGGGGGSFRGLVMGLFGKDSIINQYLP